MTSKLSLRREPGWSVPDGAVELERHAGFVALRLAGPARRALVGIEDVGQLLAPEARRQLARTVTDLGRRGIEPEVEFAGLQRGDDLVLAVALSLFVHFKSPSTTVRVLADPARINPELVGLFERHMHKPAELLKTLDQATFARMHYLVGEQDHDGVEAFAPLLRFVELIADGDRQLGQRLARALGIQKRNLQLMVTRRCHLRCVYCPIDKREADLDLALAERAVELLINSDSESFRVDFTGGEPLLRQDWVRQVIERAHERARAVGKRDSYYLVTNAIELDDDFCHFLTGHDIELEISIDGDERSHNQNTVSVVEGLNPYQALLRGFGHIRQHDIRYNAVLVFTPEGFSRLRDNLEHVLSLGFQNISINYAIGYFWEDEIIDRYVDLVSEFVDRYDMLGKGEDAAFFIKNLLYKSEPTVLNSELMLDTDGTLHLLSEWQFKKAFRHRPAPFGYSLDDLQSIDEVFYTKAQVYYLLHQIYRADDGEMLRIIHNSVETGLKVSSRLRSRLGLEPGRRIC